MIAQRTATQAAVAEGPDLHTGGSPWPRRSINSQLAATIDATNQTTDAQPSGLHPAPIPVVLTPWLGGRPVTSERKSRT